MNYYSIFNIDSGDFFYLEKLCLIPSCIINGKKALLLDKSDIIYFKSNDYSFSKKLIVDNCGGLDNVLIVPLKEEKVDLNYPDFIKAFKL